MPDCTQISLQIDALPSKKEIGSNVIKILIQHTNSIFYGLLMLNHTMKIFE